MVTKTKNKNNQTSKSTQLLTHIGLVVMLSATLLNMVEMAEKEGQRVVNAIQPSYAYAMQPAEPVNSESQSEHTSRAAKEEIPHSSSNTGMARRSPDVAGTI